jgi:DNA-binding response OmpR family regulator
MGEIRGDTMINGRVMMLTDEKEAGQLWSHVLQQRGISVVVVSNFKNALSHWTADVFDMVIIDLYSSQQDASQICQILRSEIVNPILIFTNNRSEPEMLKAYDAGVDEYVIKPVSPLVFLAKVAAWLRRSGTVPAEMLETVEAAEFQLDTSARLLRRSDGSTVKLTNLEFRLMHFMMLNQNQVLNGMVIVERVWGYSWHGDSSVLKNVIYRLRRKLEPDPQNPSYLKTVPGEGYMFRPN